MRAYYHFTIGFMVATLVAMFIISYYPAPETETACGSCAKAWWFELAEGEE